MAKRNVVLLGCGDIARRLAALMSPQQYRVIGVRRTPPVQTKDRIDYRKADVRDSAALASVLPEVPDVVVVTMTPDERNEAGYRSAYVETMESLLVALSHRTQPTIILFASSTSVYGQDQGETVNEQSPTQPNGFNGRVILEAEKLLEDSGLKGCSVRFSGIYGRGNHRLLRQVQELGPNPKKPNHFTNRIHGQDCARVLFHLIELSCSGNPIEPCYIASDNEPSLSQHVHSWLHQQLTGELASTDRMTTTSNLCSGKRCDNSLLLSSGFTFKYPDYRAGYLPLVEQYNHYE